MANTIAQNIVHQSLRIKENDVVLVTAAKHMLGLADEIVMECRKAGAETTTVYWSEPVWYWSLQELPLDWLRGASKIDLTLLDVITATIGIGGVADPRPMGKVSSERWEANSEGADHWYRKYVDRKVRGVNLDLTTVTPQRARAYGFPFAGWKKATEAALRADYSKIASTGKQARELLDNSTSDVRITAKNGTDLTFRLAGRKPWVDDGILDEADLSAGTFETNLPAGYIAIAPDENSANGKVTFDLPIPQRGKLIQGLSWSFENGQVTKFTATKNGDMTIPIWEKATGDKSRFGWFAIGFNDAAKTGFLNNTIPRGAVTLGIGENKLIGGQNQSTFAFQAALKKSTVVIGGQTIVADGKLSL